MLAAATVSTAALAFATTALFIRSSLGGGVQA